MKSLIKIGTRGSKLALCQTELIASKLKVHFPFLQIELVKIHTKGDKVQHSNFEALGPGVFTREIENALLNGEVDLAVHSAKDLATELPEGLVLGAVSEREDSRDCLVTREAKTLKTLPRGARIGTSSLRRRAQLKKLRPDLEILDIRGNVDTRLKKINDGDYDGMVVAYAGLKRLGLSNVVTEVFDEENFLPQAGQGALAVQIRKGDRESQELVKPINHETSYFRILAERSFLRRLQGGCQVPAGVTSKIEKEVIHLKATIFSADGKHSVTDVGSDSISNLEKTGILLAEKLLRNGGEEILKLVRDEQKN